MTDRSVTPLRLLVVDDNPTLLASLSHELSELGWQVCTAVDGPSASEALRDAQFDALVIDVRLPGRDGMHVLEELTATEVRPVVLVLSSNLDVSSTVRAIHSGAGDVLEKPVAARTIDARLRSLISTRAEASPSNDMIKSGSLLGESPAMRAVREQLQTVARYPELPTLILGEAGTGKQRIAEQIHALGAATGKFVRANLGALPEHLIERELLGVADGVESEVGRPGLFERAAGGTVFFEELAELPLGLHPKILRVLDTRSFRRLGGQEDIPLQARIVSSTRRRSSGADQYGDLHYRLAAFTVLLPALRDRDVDIEPLARHFLTEVSLHSGRPLLTLDPSALMALYAHHWPGNVREFGIVVSEAAKLCTGTQLRANDVQAAIREHGMPAEFEASSEVTSGTFPTSVSEPLRSLERRMITDAWETSGKNLSAAARTLGLPRTTLRDRLKKYGLR